jgi:hypothetical protein
MTLDHARKEAQLADNPPRNGEDFLPVPTAVLQRYEEAVFRLLGDGELEPANPVAAEFSSTLAAEDRAKLVAAAARSARAGRAMVDLVDIGVGDRLQNLQVTLVPLTENGSALCFLRDLTLDSSLRLALVDSRRRYKDFIDISTDFAWETGANRMFTFVSPRGGLGYDSCGPTHRE